MMDFKKLINKIENKILPVFLEKHYYGNDISYEISVPKSRKIENDLSPITKHALYLIKKKKLSKSILASYLCEHKVFQTVPSKTRNETRKLARKEANVFIDGLLETGVIFYKKVDGKNILCC